MFLESCFCQAEQLLSSEEGSFSLLPLCSGVPSSPCACIGDVCQASGISLPQITLLQLCGKEHKLNLLT